MFKQKLKSSKRLFLKVCGLTRAEDVQACLDLGVDATGFIFVPGSPRKVNPQVVARFPKGFALRVGVFANSSANQVLEIMDSLALDYAQLHGGETEEFCKLVGPHRVLKVLWPEKMSGPELEAECARFAPYCAAFLFDAGKSGGGSGKSLEFKTLSNLNVTRPWILAGGLSCENIPTAIAACMPDGLDLNSGVELSPGVKNLELIKQIRNLV